MHSALHILQFNRLLNLCAIDIDAQINWDCCFPLNQVLALLPARDATLQITTYETYSWFGSRNQLGWLPLYQAFLLHNGFPPKLLWCCGWIGNRIPWAYGVEGHQSSFPGHRSRGSSGVHGCHSNSLCKLVFLKVWSQHPWGSLGTLSGLCKLK